MLINLPGKVLRGFWGGILILFIVLLLMMNLALLHNSPFVRCTLQISLSSPSDPVRNRNLSIYNLHFSGEAAETTHFYSCVFSSLREMSLQVWKIHHCCFSEGQKGKASNILKVVA